MTDPMISMESIREHSGSTHCQPKLCINNVLIITNTEPSVSANTCKKTPKLNWIMSQRKMGVGVDWANVDLAYSHFHGNVHESGNGHGVNENAHGSWSAQRDRENGHDCVTREKHTFLKWEIWKGRRRRDKPNKFTRRPTTATNWKWRKQLAVMSKLSFKFTSNLSV